MKVGITGHTAGLGLHLSYALTKKGYEVAGLSRSNGYTFKHDPSATDRCVKKLDDEDFDVAVLNAPLGQESVFTALYKKWREKEKRIIIVNSFLRYQKVIDVGLGKQEDRTKNLNLYNTVLDNAFDNLDGSLPFRKCIINHFTFGLIDTPRGGGTPGLNEGDPRKLPKDFVVDQLINTIESDRSIEQFDTVLRVLK